LATACHAKVAWRKRNLFRKVGAQENCGPRKKFAAGIRMTRSAKLARCREYDRKRYDQDNMGQETQKRRKEGKRLWKGQECKNGVMDRGLRQQLQVKIVIKDADTRWQLRLSIKRTSDGIYGKTIGIEIVKRAVGISSGLRRLRSWALRRGRPHSET
jgi:hypothetical protein